MHNNNIKYLEKCEGTLTGVAVLHAPDLFDKDLTNKYFAQEILKSTRGKIQKIKNIIEFIDN